METLNANPYSLSSRVTQKAPFFSYLTETLTKPPSQNLSTQILFFRQYLNCKGKDVTSKHEIEERVSVSEELGRQRTIALRKEAENHRSPSLYRKSLEGRERLLYEKKQKITEALAEGKPIPTELRNEEAALHQEIDLEDDNTVVPKTHIDDEDAHATEKDPKILLTTSRNPNAPLIQFVKELKFVFPNAERINRSGQVISEIIESCRAHDYTDVIFVHEHRGVPDGLVISHLPFGPTAYFGQFNVLGGRTATILKHLFPMPKPDTKRIITFTNQSDNISFRHHIYEKHGGPKSVELKKIGPHFEMRLYQIKLGTVDQNEA